MFFLYACAAAEPADRVPFDTAGSAEGHFVLVGGTVVGVGPADVEIDAGRIVAVGAAAAGLPTVDVSGRWLVPAAIDSHVHLAYLPMVAEMAAGGVAGVVDLAAPSSWLAADHAPLRVVAAGPMITAVGGYPTQGWGREGYGIEVDGPTAAAAAVDTLYAGGARVVKVPVDGGPALDADTLAAVVGAAHGHGEWVVAHALGEEDAAAAARAGVDVLAHTPVETLSSATRAAWAGKAVVSTLSAFGGSSAAVANLRGLRDAGATVLYGTDFGNTRTAGIDARELALLSDAGLSPAEILAALTTTPAAFWGLSELGALAPGKAASVLVVGADPLRDPLVLAAPDAVWIDGVRVD